MKRLALGAVVLAIGCASHRNDTNPADAKLTLSPAQSTLMILNGSAATEAFTAKLVWLDGTSEDVTSQTSFSLPPDYGTFTANTLSMTSAGQVTVEATFMSNTGSAQVITSLQDVRVGSGVNSNAPSWFNMPEDPTRAPTIVYPSPNVIVPRNLGQFETHWTDASSNDTWEVSLSTGLTSVKVYTKGGNGSGGGPDPSWIDFLTQEWYDALGGSGTAVTLTVRGVNSQNPTAVGSAPPQVALTTNEAMNGGLYYWASSSSDPNTPYGIYRHDVSMPGVPATQYLTTAQTVSAQYPQGRCVACHVLSQDGKNMLISYDGGGATSTTVDVATGVPNASAASWNFATFTPDGTEFLAVESGTLTVRSFPSQALVATMTAGGVVSHPNLSPDGKTLVYVRPQVAGSDWAFGSGQIYTRTFDQANNTFGAENQLVADGANNYYPSFSPDGQWILFNKGDNTQNQNLNQSGSYNGPNAQLWVIKADGSAPGIPLTAANDAMGLTNSWGRWAPFAQTFGTGGEKMFWVTTSSKRNFGVRLVGVDRPQIWMTAFFPDRAAMAQDPSSLALWLPFQDITTNNHIAQWTQAIVAVQ